MVEQHAIDITTPDDVCDATVTCPSGGGKHPAILFYMDAPGIRQALLDMSTRLAEHGYYVLLPNLYYRAGRAPLFDVATAFTPENRPKVFALMQTLTPEVVVRDAGVFIDFLEAQPQVKSGPIGITGYCMGGPMMMRTAAAFPDKVAAGLSFHGAMLAPDSPDGPHTLAPKIKAELHFGMAETDQTMPEDQVERLKATLDAAGTHYTAETLPGTHHGYAIAGHVYQREGSERHWDRMLDLFGRKLQPAA